MRRRKFPQQSAIVVVIDYRTKRLMKKYVVVRKIEKVVVVSGSRGLQKTEVTHSSALWYRHNVDMVWNRIARRQGLARSAWYSYERNWVSLRFPSSLVSTLRSIYIWSVVLLRYRVPSRPDIGWDGCPLATRHYYYCVMRGSCKLKLIGMDYDYVVDVVAGSKACIAGYNGLQAYNSCIWIL